LTRAGNLSAHRSWVNRYGDERELDLTIKVSIFVQYEDWHVIDGL
jgi:hypothetical protein